MPIVKSISLNQNIITKALFNMIISQHIFDGKVASAELANKFRVDGTLYGDTKIYQSFDIGALQDWLNDREAANLLELNRNRSGVTQTITMGVYKMAFISIDRYLSKQAFMGEGTFAAYTSFLTGSLRKIKKVYDRSLINNKLGTLEPSTSRCDIVIKPPKGATIEETNRLEAQTIAARMVILRADLEDNNRDFNALNYLRSYDPGDLIAVWNVEKKSKITKLDLPSLFHKDINETGGFSEFNLPQKWFGKKATQDLTLPTSAPAKVTNRVSVSGWYNVRTGGKATIEQQPSADTVFLWAGDAVPYKGQVYEDYARGYVKSNGGNGNAIVVTSTIWDAENYYVEDPTIAFVLVDKNALPFMSGFEVGTEFYNPRSLTTTHFLIFGHNNLEWIEEYPRIRVRVEQEA